MEFSEIREKLRQKKQEKGILIAAHRGTFGGSVVQNTILSYKNALLHGADIVEMDVAESADGVLYGHHFGTEKRVYGKAFGIRQMNAREIDGLISENPIGMPMESSLCRLDDVLEEFKGKCYINIDHAWFKHYLEYCKKGCNKGAGLLRLSHLSGCPVADTIAVGDERNDISMIQAAGFGAAMQNARPEVKAAAVYVTESDCDHSGVAEIMNRFVLEEVPDR